MNDLEKKEEVKEINFQRITNKRVYQKPVEFTSLVETYCSYGPYATNEQGELINNSPYQKRICTGKKDLQEIIDSNAESTNYYRLIDAFLVSGEVDVSILSIKNGVYCDISCVPNDPNDLQNAVNALNIKKNEPQVEVKIESEEKK